jgi:hypothetical protein
MVDYSAEALRRWRTCYAAQKQSTVAELLESEDASQLRLQIAMRALHIHIVTENTITHGKRCRYRQAQARYAFPP